MPNSIDPLGEVELRMQYRCLMCHKRCLIPCRFTAVEFQEMVLDRLASQALTSAKDENDPRITQS